MEQVLTDDFIQYIDDVANIITDRTNLQENKVNDIICHYIEFIHENYKLYTPNDMVDNITTNNVIYYSK